jgi:hypothetical protein
MIVFTYTILYLILVNAGVTYVEGKRELVMLEENIHQLVAISITCAFTAHNLNERLNSMVPTILTNHNSFVVCLYTVVGTIFYCRSHTCCMMLANMIKGR